MRILLALLALLTASLAQATPGVLERHSLRVGDLTRSFLIYEPFWRQGEQLPLVFLIHGGMSDAEQFTKETAMTKIAEREGWVMIAPDSHGSSWNYGDTLPPWLEDEAVDDMAFFDALVALASSRYNVDPTRIHSTGVSAGGVMSYRLACERPGLLAAIAPVAASKNTADCPGAAGTSVLHIHGTADTNVPLEGNDTFPPVREGFLYFREANACPQDDRPTQVSATAEQHQWAPCANGAEATFILVEGGGHDWSFDFGTNDVIAAFLGRH